MKTALFLVFALVGAALWIIDLQRRLQAAHMRGDMYRDISARLDKRVADLMSGERSI